MSARCHLLRSFFALVVSGLLVTANAATAFAASDAVAKTQSEDLIHSSEQIRQAQDQANLNLTEPPLSWRKAQNTDPVRWPAADPEISPQPGPASSQALNWETGENKSFLIPALEVPSFVVLLNVFDRLAFPNKMKEGRRAYNSNLSTTWEHLRRQNWRYDRDTFVVNQFGHPYEGATFFGIARSSGLNFWQSWGYSHAGSFLWEMAGETSSPSINDLITTGNAGTLLGEALFRMAGLVLEDAGDHPGTASELVAAATSPPTGFNRLIFGDRFKTVFPSHQPALFWQAMFGGNFDVHSTDLRPEASSNNANVIAGLTMSYGLPGKPGYSYRRPFDYFDFQVAFRSRLRNPLEEVTVRGLLVGKDYGLGDDYRGIWGLYGSYDYIAPHLYRVSSTALSLGSTAQYWLAPGVALQGSLLGGLGFGAAGTETDTEETEERSYHFGATPQGLLALSLLFGERAMFDVTGRAYYYSGSNMDQVILRGDAGLTFRITDRHGVAVRYSESLRDTKNNSNATKHLSEGTLSLVYTYLGDKKFGAVEWRDATH